MARELPGQRSARGERAPLLFIHGAGSGSWVWSRWMQALAALHWSCWGPDLRGHGASTPVDLRFVSMLDYLDRKSTRLNSSHIQKSRMPSSA